MNICAKIQLVKNTILEVLKDGKKQNDRKNCRKMFAYS